MSRRRMRPIERGYDTLRVALEIIALAVILLMSPIAALLTPATSLEREWPLVTVVYLCAIGFVAWDLRRTILAHRRSVTPPGVTERPGKDLVWDRVDQSHGTLRGLRSMGAPFARRTSDAELSRAVLKATRAVPLDASRPDVQRASEAASAAVGLSLPPALYWARDAGANACVAGAPGALFVVLGEGMLATFTADELLGVLASILSRVESGIAKSVTGPVGKSGFGWPSDRVTPALVLDLYKVSDARAVLALRDPQPVLNALRKTIVGDPFFPGLTADQAQLMWTWPSLAGPWIPETDGQVVQGIMDVLLTPNAPLAPRIEAVRLDALEDVGATDEAP